MSSRKRAPSAGSSSNAAPGAHQQQLSAQEVDKKRKKQHKRMTKILARIWQLDGSDVFQSHPVWSLQDVGTRLDEQSYKTWNAFARDLGSVYTTHIHKNATLTSAAAAAAASNEQLIKTAQIHLNQVMEILSEKDPALKQIAADAPPKKGSKLVSNNNKRKRNTSEGTSNSDGNKKHSQSRGDGAGGDDSAGGGANGTSGKSPNKRPRTDSAASNHVYRYNSKNPNPELAEREVRAMEQLYDFLQEQGGDAEELLEGFRVRVTRKKQSPSANTNHSSRYDVNFFSAQNRRFRSMLEVGRFYNLVNDSKRASSAASSRSASNRRGSGKKTSKEQEAEKKRIRRELDKLRKALNRANANLDDFGATAAAQKRKANSNADNNEEEEEEDHDEAMEEEEEEDENQNKVSEATRRQCAATRVCDVTQVPFVPSESLPDVLLVWDFLSTFSKVLSLQPISLPDFGAALAYEPPDGGDDDFLRAPPVFLAETHLALLKLILEDKASDDWWWSTLENPEDFANLGEGNATSNPKASSGTASGENSSAKDDADTQPVIKVDMTMLLAQQEDSVVTTSWVKSLSDDVSKERSKPVKTAIKTTMKMMSNKYAKAYLRKAISLSSNAGGVSFIRKAVHWLVKCIERARPDLFDPNSIKSNKDSLAQRARVAEEAAEQIAALAESVPEVTDDDVAEAEDEDSDDSDDEDDDDDDEKDEDEDETKKDEAEGREEKPASYIPPKPLPTLADLLLPPDKPSQNAEYLNPFTWSHLTGAAVQRVLHRKKRLWNEIDDGLRASQELPPLSVTSRTEREEMAASRVLTECLDDNPDKDPKSKATNVENAVSQLCSGGGYLDLNFSQRLSILRLLIEAAYDSSRIYDVIDSNYKQRMSAMKSLEQEKKKAKKDAREKAAADEAAAREKLAVEARDKFLDEKREEIRQLNEKSEELTEDVLDSLTDEDIIEFDEDIKADYEALPTPESFNKTQVNAMVKRMHEEAAFETDSLRVLTLEEIVERDKLSLEEMEGQLLGFGGEEALDDPDLDRETIRTIERLRRDIDRARNQVDKLPSAREKAIEQLQDAIRDGTIKVLRSAVTAAKKAKLSGPDEETGGTWALDLMRDAALELENAKQNKKLVDAQKELVAKRNKCFIRTDPIGRDRFGNRFWTFSHEEDGRVWVEADFSLQEQDETKVHDPPEGYSDVVRAGDQIVVGAPDMEDDFVDTDEVMDKETCRSFSRKEYHYSGFSSQLVHHSWGCQATEDSLRAVIKGLDVSTVREKDLKASLKESLENIVGTGDKHETEKEDHNADEEQPGEVADTPEAGLKTAGDEEHITSAKRVLEESAEVSHSVDDLSSAVGKRVRVRIEIESTRDNPLARYENGTVNAWTMRTEERDVQPDSDSDSDYERELEPRRETVSFPVWRVLTEIGYTVWLEGGELLESVSRHEKWEAGRGYFEQDAAFLGYRNTLGKFCGKNSEAPHASSPIYFARMMVKREGELYAKLKHRSYDNTWGGKSGARGLWTNSMKDYAFDFQTVKQGLLTLEGAFFELTGEFEEYTDIGDEPDAKALLADPTTRVDLELETIENNVPGLWNSPASRAVFLEIVSNSETTGFLALALDLLCRNTFTFLQKHKLLNVRTSSYEETVEVLQPRRTRRRNATQPNYNEDWF